MVRIRLARSGSKKRPFYYIVAAEQRDKRDGRFIERIGYFNPMAKGQDSRLTINVETYQQWLKKGAQPSERILSLVKQYEQSGQSAAAA